ncbi:MAG TPA: hypothetical protein VIL34_18080 [Actinopolymorphaceae bacterium]|jgi:hypothetical protein
MSWSKGVRQTHRWLALAFTITVIVCFIAIAQEKPPMWVFYTPLLPLGLLLFTGLNLFVLPYVTKRRSRQHSARESETTA